MLSQHKGLAGALQPEGSILDLLGGESEELSFEMNLESLQLSDAVSLEGKELTHPSQIQNKLGIVALALNEFDESTITPSELKVAKSEDTLALKSSPLNLHTSISQANNQSAVIANAQPLENSGETIINGGRNTSTFSDTKFTNSPSQEYSSENLEVSASTALDNKFAISNSAELPISSLEANTSELALRPQGVYIPQQHIAAHISTFTQTIEPFEEVEASLELNSEDSPKHQEANQLIALEEEASGPNNEYKMAVASSERAEYYNSDFNDSNAEEVILFEEVDGHTNYVNLPTDKATREMASLSDIKFNKLMDPDILSKASNVMEQVKFEVTQAVESKKDVVKFLLNPSNLGELEIKFTTDPITKQLNVSILSERYSTLDMLGNISKDIEAVIQETHASSADISLNLGLQERSRNFQDMINQHSKSQNETAEYDGATKTYVAAINTYGFTSDGGLNIVV